MPLVFSCKVCATSLSAEESQVGTLVRCPSCLTTLRVPAAAAAAAVAAGVSGPITSSASRAPTPPPTMTRAGAGLLGARGGKRYGFNCGYCSSRLEATEAMAAQEGQCPTCGNTIVIPILDRYGRLIDPKTQQIIKQDPHPVHAYAAAGDRAPRILRQPGGQQNIQCPRCNALSPITANNCKACGMPFTMEGTTLEASGTSNGFCVASLVLGIIGIPAGCTILVPLLAIVFGVIGYNQINNAGGEASGKGMAIAGIVCGVVGTLIGIMIHM
jgi:DNA-directed RNA polymerase subunit RPC12/RpoP